MMHTRRAAFDFDGTIAAWRQGSEPDYSDPEATMRDCYSNPNLRWIALQLQFIGVQLVVITGRNERHRDVIHRWLQFYGIVAQIHCRPSHIGLSCHAQASWKASVLREIHPILFVGDNPYIDEAGAKMANVSFVHVDQAAEALEQVRGQQSHPSASHSLIHQFLDTLL